VARIPLAGGFYEDSAIQFDSQRSVNMYPVVSEVGNSKSILKLKNTPGIKNFLTSAHVVSGGDTIMTTAGMHVTADERLFVFYYVKTTGPVLEKLYAWEVFEDGTSILRINTTVTASFEYVKTADNGSVITIQTGADGFFYNLSTNTAALITDPDFPAGVFDVFYKDTYFIWLDSVTDRFYISSNNATDPANCVNALDFSTVESNPDSIKAIIGSGNEIAIFGNSTIEFFYNSGNVDFPFERNSGATQEIGTVSTRAVSKINNSIYFLGANETGYGVVYKMNGYTPKRISTHPIEQKLQSSSDLSAVISYTYQQEGSYFYVLTIPDIETTFCYDESSGLWHERVRTLPDTTPEEVVYYRHLVTYQEFVFNKNIVTDNETVIIDNNAPSAANTLYYYDMDYKVDDLLSVFSQINDLVFFQTTLIRERTFPHITNENKNIQYNYLELDVQKGVGNVSDTDPEINLYISRDGGHTFGNKFLLPMGSSTDYIVRTRADMLGVSRDTVFKIISGSPVQHEWFTAYIDIEVMNE